MIPFNKPCMAGEGGALLITAPKLIERANILRERGAHRSGGDFDFFNSFVKSLSVGKAVEGMAGKSPIVSELLTRLLDSKLLSGKSSGSDTAGHIGHDA